MFTAIAAAAAEVCRDEPGVRAVVLHGEGPSFCSGIDVGRLAGRPEGGDDVDLLAREGPRQANLAQRVAYDWSPPGARHRRASTATCFGGGLQIALGADIRIAAPDARLSVMEIRWGLVPDMGITQSLPRLVPLDVAKELTFTGRRVHRRGGGRARARHARGRRPARRGRELAAEIASPLAARGPRRASGCSRPPGRPPTTHPQARDRASGRA